MQLHYLNYMARRISQTEKETQSDNYLDVMQLVKKFLI